MDSDPQAALFAGDGPLSCYADPQLIGVGVSARVYKAVDTTTDSPVAVKVLNPHLNTDEISIERFRREIQITRFLNHPRIISIYDLIDAGDSLALIMEYLSGCDLKDYVKLHAPLDVVTALGILTQILEVLALCHRKDVIHRDLKPQNVVIDQEKRVKLLDFGIARMTSLSDLTQTGTSLGSPEYMAPELFAANTFDPRTDLYALGVMAHEMLTGELPFQGDSVAVLFHQHLEAPVPRVSATHSDVPQWLDGLIAKLLAKDPYQRYQTAEEVLLDVERRRVLSKSLPRPARRECLSCARQTLAELPLCTYCGYEHFETFERGQVDVSFSPDADPDKIRQFLTGAFTSARQVARPAGRLLVTGVDRLAAELLKTAAQQHGLYLRVKQRRRMSGLLRVLTSCLFLLAMYQLVMALLARRWWVQYTGDVKTLVLAISVQTLGLWLGYRLYRWQHPMPLVGARFLRELRELAVAGLVMLALAVVAFPWALVGWWLKPVVLIGLLAALSAAAWWYATGGRPRQGRKGTLAAKLLAEHDWVRELAPLLAEVRSAGLRDFTAQLIEKFYLLRGHVPDLAPEIEDRLKLLIRSAAKVAGLISEIDAAVGDAELAAWSREYASWQARCAAEPDPGRREVLRGQAASVAEKLRSYYELDGRRGRLNRRLIHLQYAFNTLLGKSLVLHHALGDPEARELETAARDLERDLAISREVRKELRQLA